jgi:hypothetical protein
MFWNVLVYNLNSPLLHKRFDIAYVMHGIVIYGFSVMLSIYKFNTNIFLHIYFLYFIVKIKEKSTL